MGSELCSPSLNASAAIAPSEKHYAFLDALRGWAVLGVILSHFFHDFGVHSSLFLNFIGNGVTLFYILSAFCLFLSLSHKDSPDWRAYSIRRIFRIAPAFYFAIIVWSCFKLMNGERLDFASIATSALFLNGFFPKYIHSAIPYGWSVAVETTFYLILPLFFVALRTFRLSVFAFIILTPPVLFFSWALARWVPSLGGYTVYWLPSQLPVFLLGIVAYKFSTSDSFRVIVWRERLVVHWFVPLLAFGGVLIAAAVLPARIRIVGVSFFLVIIIIWLMYNKVALCVNRFICAVGIISFSAYLFHGLAIRVMLAFFPVPQLLSPWGKFLALVGTIGITCFMAGVSYHLIERPGIKLGGFLIKRCLSISH